MIRWALIFTVFAGSAYVVYGSVAAYGQRILDGTPQAAVPEKEPLPKFDRLWVRWFSAVLREPGSARWSAVRTWRSTEVELGGEVRTAAVQRVRLTGRNGFGGRSVNRAWIAVPAGRAPWFRLDDGAWASLAEWEAR